MATQKNICLVVLLLSTSAMLALAAPSSCGTQPPPGSESQLAYIQCSLAAQSWDAAENQIRSFRRQHPDSVNGALLEAQLLMSTQRAEDARQVLAAMLHLHPDSVPTLAFMAELSEKLSQPAEAEKYLSQATRYAPKNAEAWKRLGDLYLAKQPKQAITCFKHAVDLAPKDAVALAGLATAFHEAEQPVMAKNTFARAIAINRRSKSSSAIVDYLFARYLDDEQRFPESVPQYNLALRDDPDFTDAYFGRAQALIELHDWAAAARDLERTVKTRKHAIPSLVLLVRVYRESGQQNKAKEYSERLAKVSNERDSQRVAGNEVAGQIQAATKLMEQRKFDEASQEYERLLSLHPEVSQAWLQLGQCYAEAGRFRDAEGAFRKVVAADGSSLVARSLLGQVLLREGLVSAAREEFNRVLQIDALNTDARLGLAATYMVEKNYAGAIQALRSARAILGLNQDVDLMLAEALFKDDQRTAALREVNTLLKADPANRAAKQMLEAMEVQKH